MYTTKNIKPYAIHFGLLQIVDEGSNGLFVYIKDFEKLMGTSGKHKRCYCKHCLSNFTSHERLCNHYKTGCYDVVGTLKLMPKEDQSNIEYTSRGHEEHAPFVSEGDFECFLYSTHSHRKKQYNIIH